MLENEVYRHISIQRRKKDTMAVDKKGKLLPSGVRQRQDEKYEGRVQYEHKRYSVYADTLAEVKRKMNDLRYRLEHDEFIASTKITLGEWFEIWMEQYKRGVKRGTQITYKDYFKYYIKDGLIDRNPVEYANLPKQRNKFEMRVLTVKEQEIFMEYAKDSYLYNMFEFALKTGLRSGELRGLKLIDIDKTSKMLYVRRTLKALPGGGHFEDTPKTGCSLRDVPLRDDILDIIDRQKKVYGDKVLRIEGYIFSLHNGLPISRGRFENEIKRIVKKINDAGIEFEKFTPHCFRHTFATRAIESGMDPQVLKVILGHSDYAMTMNRYAHVLDDAKAQGMEQIASAF